MEKFKLDNVKKRFKNDKKLHEDYPKFMQDMINKSHSRLQHEAKFKQGKANYIHIMLFFLLRKPGAYYIHHHAVLFD